MYECPLRDRCHYEFQYQLCDDEDYAMCIHFDIIEKEMINYEIRYKRT